MFIYYCAKEQKELMSLSWKKAYDLVLGKCAYEKKSNIANFLTKNTPSNGNSRLNKNTLSNYNFMDKKHPTRLKNWEFRLRTLIYAYKKLFLLIKIRFKVKKKKNLRELSCTCDGTLHRMHPPELRGGAKPFFLDWGGLYFLKNTIIC